MSERIPRSPRTGVIVILVSALSLCPGASVGGAVPGEVFSSTASLLLLHEVGPYLPDTGQVECYDNGGPMVCPAQGQPFHGQDAQYTAYPMSYTDNGDGTVTENVTGLIWRKCPAGLSGVDCSQGPLPLTKTWQEAVTHCEEQITGGSPGWRLPTAAELQGLVDYGTASPAINPAFFPAAGSGLYWSSSASAGDPLRAWIVTFSEGYVAEGFKTGLSWVRCTRGDAAATSLANNGDGTVTDGATGLMWQRETSYVDRTWQEALRDCQDLVLPAEGGYQDWRLPNIKELRSIVDGTRCEPAIDESVFPGTPAGTYWSSTTRVESPSAAWGVHFGNGDVGAYTKIAQRYVRCVR